MKAYHFQQTTPNHESLCVNGNREYSQLLIQWASQQLGSLTKLLTRCSDQAVYIIIWPRIWINNILLRPAAQHSITQLILAK